MLRVWMPEVESRLPAPSLYVAQAGYSLAGLFTLWSTWQTDVFKRIACVSASLWYPHLIDYLTDHRPACRPDRIYFSLGDKESRTRHPLMSQVETCTRSVHDLVREMGIPTHFEMNPGNHFTAPDKRMAKAVAWIFGITGNRTNGHRRHTHSHPALDSAEYADQLLPSASLPRQKTVCTAHTRR